jgi:WD40 repeat protein
MFGTSYEKLLECHVAHSGKISHVALTPDHRTLFTVGLDGSIFIYNVHEQLFNQKDKTFKASIT